MTTPFAFIELTRRDSGRRTRVQVRHIVSYSEEPSTNEAPAFTTLCLTKDQFTMVQVTESYDHITETIDAFQTSQSNNLSQTNPS